MQKKILAFVCAMTMVLGMSMSVCAAGSNDAPSAADNAKNEVVSAPAAENTTGQVLVGATIEEFAETTTVTAGPAGASITAASNETAKAVIAEANKVVGKNAFVASVVELHGGAGTYTLGCPNVWKGQKVYVLHQKADGSFETIVPDSVANNSVTFTLTSTSPIALIVDVAAPKTGDVAAAVAVMAVACMAGAAVFGKKARA